MAQKYVWKKISTTTDPTLGGTRQFQAVQMAYDASLGYTLLLGGTDANTFPAGSYAETWKWQNNDWTKLTPVLQPPQTFGCAMCYYPGVGIILFGGQNGEDGSTMYNTTYRWDGPTSNWVLISTAHKPTARYFINQNMAYHAGRGTLLLLGGMPATFIAQNDLWEFNATDWTQIYASTSSTSVPPKNSDGWVSASTGPTQGGLIRTWGGTGSIGGVNRSTWEYSTAGVWTEIATNSPSFNAGVYGGSCTWPKQGGVAITYYVDTIDQTAIESGNNWSVLNVPNKTLRGQIAEDPNGDVVMWCGILSLTPGTYRLTKVTGSYSFII